MAKDLEQRFDAAIKKGEKQDKAKKTGHGGWPIDPVAEKNKKTMKNTHEAFYGNKRSTSDGYMPRKESVIERSNRLVAKRDAGKTKDQISKDAFKSGRTSGRY